MRTLSIIVPVYNAERYLNRCVASILSQGRTDFEMILIDDGSTDSSGALCDGFATQHSNVIAIHQRNRGVSAARNAGISYASGKYISFVDSDDWIDANMYYEPLRQMDNNDSIDICVCGMVKNYTDGSEADICLRQVAHVFSCEDAVEELFRWNYFRWELCGKIYRRKLFDNFQMDEKIHFGEDLDANWELFHRAQCVFYSSDRQYHYYENETSATHAYLNYIFDDSTERLCTKILTSPYDKSVGVLRKVYSIYISYLIQKIKIMLFVDFSKYSAKCKKYINLLRDNRFNISQYLDTDFSIVEDNLAEVKKHIVQKREAIHDMLNEAFCSYPNVYVYGTGMISKYVNILLKQTRWNCTAYVVSDGQRKPVTYNNTPALYLSQVEVDNDKNVFYLAVSKKHLHEIQHLLRTMGHKNYEFIDLDILLSPLGRKKR